jgi:glycosyltransferase involved in cell wall biosynthesis
MRVAIFTGTFVENKDGVARSLYELVRSLRSKGHTVGIWAPEFTPQEDPEVHLFEIPSIPIPLYPDYRMTIYLKNIFKELDKFKPDIIQISTPDLIALKFLKYGKEANIPIVSIYHTDFPSYLKYYKLQIFESTVWKKMVQFYNKCDAVFTPTNEMKEQLEKKGARRVEIWSRGIRKDSFDPSKRSDELRRSWGADGKTVVLYSGRFVKYKDLDIVEQVYQDLMENKKKGVKFVLLGSGPMEKELKNKMPDAVFPGYLTGDELHKAYASGDIFLFPSTTETFGNVVQEAISSGLPAVVSDIGGCKEIVIESDAGIVCRAKDADHFSDSVSNLIEDEEYYLALKQKGLIWSKTRTWDSINDKLIEMFYELIGNDNVDGESP